MNELKLNMGEVENKKVVVQIYLNAGFKIVKIIDHDNGQSMALYEIKM